MVRRREHHAQIGRIARCEVDYFPRVEQLDILAPVSYTHLFNVRKASNVNPLPVFQKIAEGAFGATVTYTGTEYSQDWTFNPAGYTITYADIQ